MIEALLGFAAIFALALLRIPLAFAMGLVGFIGMATTRGMLPALTSTAQVVQETGFAYTLSVIPLFILMGNFVARAGLAHELFQAAYAFVGHLRGGLAHATVAACAGFGAICGSSIATAATMSRVAYPSMRKLGYSASLSTGAMAAGGTLGIMIPPSTIMVIYGIITETHIGKLFAAGVIPGLLTTGVLMGVIALMTARDPEHAPPGAAFGACCSWCLWCWAAFMAACSPPLKAPALARLVRFYLRWHGAVSPGPSCSKCWSNRPAPRPCCSPC